MIAVQTLSLVQLGGRTMPVAHDGQAAETPRSEIGFVHGFVHETQRDRLRWGRRTRPDTTSRRRYAMVNAVITLTVSRDHPRCLRRAS